MYSWSTMEPVTLLSQSSSKLMYGLSSLIIHVCQNHSLRFCTTKLNFILWSLLNKITKNLLKDTISCSNLNQASDISLLWNCLAVFTKSLVIFSNSKTFKLVKSLLVTLFLLYTAVFSFLIRLWSKKVKTLVNYIWYSRVWLLLVYMWKMRMNSLLFIQLITLVTTKFYLASDQASATNLAWIEPHTLTASKRRTFLIWWLLSQKPKLCSLSVLAREELRSDVSRSSSKWNVTFTPIQ